MKTIGFLGAYDKLDLLLYTAKILTLSGKKVLLVDSTTTQKTRYIVPAIRPTKSYITEFEEFDVAVGFKNLEEIQAYQGTELKYDIVLLDIDSAEAVKNYDITKNDKNCFVTGFDLYSLKKGVELLAALPEANDIIKILFSVNMTKEENEYLDYLASMHNVKWNNVILNFPIEVANYSVTIENQYLSRIKMRKVSSHYKVSLEYYMEVIFGEDINQSAIKKFIKKLEGKA